MRTLLTLMLPPIPLLVLPLVSCGGYEASAPAPTQMSREENAKEAADEAGGYGAPMGGAAPEEPTFARPAAPAAAAPVRAAEGRVGKKAKIEADGAEAEATESAPAALRSWFPESFLWSPLVETDASGQASVSVTVPDTLTTWRVLALGQSREGAQAGSVTTFRSTLPAYVDLTVPAFLYVGDRPGFAVQVVNQTAELLRGELTFLAEGGQGGAGGNVEVGPWGSLTRAAPVLVSRAGQLVLRANLGSVDAVERRVEVRPVGRPVTMRRGGTLAASREVRLLVDPAGRDGRLSVEVFPGALALLQAEIQHAGARGRGLWGDAYAFSLSTEGSTILEKSGVSPESLRALRLGAWQRLRSQSLNPGVPEMIGLVAGLDGADKSSLEGQTRSRVAQQLVEAQQPDGLWGMDSGAAIDTILVRTAMAAWALGPDQKAAQTRARGAMERYRDRLSAPNVAAWALYAGLLDGVMAEKAEKVVNENLAVAADGSRYAKGRGGEPSAEMTALSALIVKDEALRADLVTWLLGRYAPTAGFGDGLADLLSLRALRAALSGEIPNNVVIILESSGKELARASLDPAQPHQPVRLAGPTLPPDANVTLRAEPPVPGLAFALDYTAWVPWTQAAPTGLDIVVAPVGPLVAGVESELEVRVVAPTSVTAPVNVEVGLPAGMELAEPAASADVLVSLVGGAPAPQDHGDHLTWTAVPMSGGAWTTRVKVRPTLPGVLQTGPSSVQVGAEQFVRTPSTWTVR